MKKIFLVFMFIGIVFRVHSQTPQLFDFTKRWILVDNNIVDKEIVLTPYDSTKFEMNTLILQFSKNHKIDYDYESHAEVCYGVDFLDIDLDKTSWIYNPLTNLLVLTLKGGYSSLDDFKFKREYEVLISSEGDFILQQTKQYYYVDLQKQEEEEVSRPPKTKKK